MEFLSRSWSASALEVSKALSSAAAGGAPTLPLSLPPQAEDPAGEVDDSPAIAGNTFSFASSATSQLVMERIMSQSVSLSSLFLELIFLTAWGNDQGISIWSFSRGFLRK